ncbi:MAG TPA: plastocyanin/azurin family copper-binding protein [Gemmatimonadaceae bacterium]|nr:plastocyanin/azurin family copper-binding protein [Gemmatimonadaceae bacterium]
MRFHGLVLVAAVAALSACGGGGETANTDTTATAGTATTPAAGTATGTAAPVTGTVHEVKMIGDEKGYRFDPVDITIKAGDGIKWVMVSGGPHNVQFENIAADVKAQLSANMPNQLSDLSSPMLINPNETYEISFANVKPGKYAYVCTPHLANNMRGSVTVQ